MIDATTPPGNAPPAPPLAWEQHAGAGRIADAVAAYVQHYDWTTFAELGHRLAPYFEMKGDMALELKPNVVLWGGMSPAFTDAVLSLVNDRRLYLHPCTTLAYLIDGGALRMPVARATPPAGYKRPRWLPVALRDRPIRRGLGRGRVILPSGKGVAR